MKHRLLCIGMALIALALLVACEGEKETPISTPAPTAMPATVAEPPDIDSDAFQSTVNPSAGTGGSSSNSNSSSGEYWCMGKGDTCKNKTSSAYDFYCSSCDKNNNNIEDNRE